ncbi:hypothetical protein LZ32DRAFT_363091 [Colletotrichum eremochloae]|nr:hypothetical protein LZ32DRAFT_363091 [Colletotrichum eremochloae]
MPGTRCPYHRHHHHTHTYNAVQVEIGRTIPLPEVVRFNVSGTRRRPKPSCRYLCLVKEAFVSVGKERDVLRRGIVGAKPARVYGRGWVGWYSMSSGRLSRKSGSRGSTVGMFATWRGGASNDPIRNPSNEKPSMTGKTRDVGQFGRICADHQGRFQLPCYPQGGQLYASHQRNGHKSAVFVPILVYLFGFSALARIRSRI